MGVRFAHSFKVTDACVRAETFRKEKGLVEEGRCGPRPDGRAKQTCGD